MQHHQKDSKRGHQEIQPRDHSRNVLGIKEPEESPKKAEARPRQTDHTPNQAGWKNPDPNEVPEETSWEREAALPDMKNETTTTI